MQWKQLYRQVLKEGYRTGDIMSEGCTQVGTVQMGDLIAETDSLKLNGKTERKR